MNLEIKNPSTLSELSALIAEKKPILLTGAKTGTVIPYDKLSEILSDRDGDLRCVSTQNLPAQIRLCTESSTSSSADVEVEGSVSWADLRQFLRSKGLDLKVSPTEELAQVCAGAATSCTGELSFAYGAFRDQVVEIDFIDSAGRLHTLRSSENLRNFSVLEAIDTDLWDKYDRDYSDFKQFKNAPFPRYEKSTDLMIGSEGQFGAITRVRLKTRPMKKSIFLGLSLGSSWLNDMSAHREVFYKLQELRGEVLSVELIDTHSLQHTDFFCKDEDLLLLEVLEESFEKIYEYFLSQLENIAPNQIFELNEGQQRHLRAAVPRWIQEEISRHHVVKVGTDTQFRAENFDRAVELYRKLANNHDIPIALFGHFGDLHLHFNFLVKNETQKTYAEKLLESFYSDVALLKGSPFTEHGIGLLKQKYLDIFYGQTQKKFLSELKKCLDPENIFFPLGHFSKENP